MAEREERDSRPRMIASVAAHEPAQHLAARSPLAHILGAPLMSSAARPGWDRILVELRRSDDWEGEARLPFHLVGCVLRPPRHLACRLDSGRVRAGHPAVGELIVVPARRNHWAAWAGGYEFLVAYLAPDTLVRAVRDDGLDADGFDLSYQFRAHDAEVASLLLALRHELASSGTEDRLYVDTLGVQLAVKLLRDYGTAPLHLREYRHGLSRAKMRIVLDYLNAYLDRNISLAELADLVDMSRYHFLRLFRASSGRTPHRYLVERRVEVAKTILLREDVPLAEIAYRVGFADQSHFTRHFRRITGAPPGRLRRQRQPPF